MKIGTILLLVTLVSMAVPSTRAQQWTAAEQELMTTMEQCWDAWAQAMEAKDYSLFADPCLASDEVRFWWTEWSSPNSTRELERGMSRGLFDWDEARSDWVALRPLAITMDGDRALVYFTAHWQNETNDGEINFFEQRRFEVWRKTDGTWKQFGGMASPVDDD